MTVTDVLNGEMLEELKEIMEEEFPSLLEIFLMESERQYFEAKQAWETQDYDVLRRAAHSLKGCCSNIGAEQLQQACASLEDSARDSEPRQIPELLDVVFSQLDRVNMAVKALL
jgi:HPt (histidine-containing phosphotransfer) domain-containing protein